MQRILLLGNLGKDREERFTKDGKKLIVFSLAVTTRKNSPATWYECIIWENRIPLFEKMLPYIKKGSRLLVGGDFLTPEIYQGRDGKPRINLRMEVSWMTFCGGNKEDNQQEQQKQVMSPSVFESFTNEEIPF
jgi:single-strand DNA-binding protein